MQNIPEQKLTTRNEIADLKARLEQARNGLMIVREMAMKVSEAKDRQDTVRLVVDIKKSVRIALHKSAPQKASVGLMGANGIDRPAPEQHEEETGDAPTVKPEQQERLLRESEMWPQHDF